MSERERGVTPQQLADYLKISRVAVFKAIQRGEITSAWQDDNGRWHIDPDKGAAEYKAAKPGTRAHLARLQWRLPS